MDQQETRTRLLAEMRGLVRIYRAMDGNAIGLASVVLDGLDQSWRDRVQRIRALPREAPRRKQMIEALRHLIAHTLAKRTGEIDTLRSVDAALAAEALKIAQAAPSEDSGSQSPPPAPESPASES